MSSVSREDMVSCIEEWFAQECTLEGVCELYADLRLEIDKQKNFMLKQVARSLREDAE